MSTPTITVAPGPKNARTDPATGLRLYRWQGRELPSVTSLRRVAGVPFGLHHWALGKVAEHVIEHWAEIGPRLEHGGIVDLQVVRQELRGAAGAERDAAARLGSAVHDAAATGRRPEEVPAEVAPRLRQYHSWLAASGAEVLAAERQVWNLTLGYAGTFDLLCRLRDGTVWLVDIKTGKSGYPEHALQLMAYSMAEFVGQDDTIDEAASALLRDVSGMAILHLADEGWEFLAVRSDPATWTAFRGLLSFAAWMVAHPDMPSVTVASRAGREAAA